MANSTTYRYEFTLPVVSYLLRAVETQQIRGEQQSRDLVSVLDLLRNPTNMAEIEKSRLDALKAKYEPVTEKQEEDKKDL